MYQDLYSGTSLKGLSELRTIQKTSYHANTFLPLKEENLYITAKMTQKMASPKVSIIKVP